MSKSVYGNGENDDCPDDHLLHPFGPAHLLSAHIEDGDDEGADDGAGNGAFAARETGPSDNDGGDNEELVHDSGRWLTDASDVGKLH